MASTSNESSSDLVDDFEESFQACVHALTKQEVSTGIDKNEIGLEVEQTTSKFIDLARQIESFFIQKRFVLSALKPELMLKEENMDLRCEINRKDELMKKHYERIELWKQLLSDQPQPQLHHPPPHMPMHMPQHLPTNHMPVMPMSMPMHMGHVGMPPSELRPMPMGMPKNMPGQMVMGGAGMTPVMQNRFQAQMQAQHMQQQQQQQQQQLQQQHQAPHGMHPQQQQQQHLMQAQQMQQMQIGGPPMFSPQAMASPRSVPGGGPGMMPGNIGNFVQGPNVGPLAYLEKTTSNIGIDGRR